MNNDKFYDETKYRKWIFSSLSNSSKRNKYTNIMLPMNKLQNQLTIEKNNRCSSFPAATQKN